MSYTEYSVIAETFPRIHGDVTYYAAKYADADKNYERDHNYADLLTKASAHAFLHGVACTMVALKAISNGSEYINTAIEKARARA